MAILTAFHTNFVVMFLYNEEARLHFLLFFVEVTEFSYFALSEFKQFSEIHRA